MLLGLSTEEFYSLTPRQFFALQDRRKEIIEHNELQTGIIAATVANFTANWSMGAPKTPLSLKPSDFMPSQEAEQPKKRITKKYTKKMQKNFHDDVAHLFKSGYFKGLEKQLNKGKPKMPVGGVKNG